ncbi:hypothetical protein CYMTET_9896 [Cymbomonas tetramitiformis]|uniref:Uncharacterized protein n=1 Tax=Cymbomonas tetramitiformis TaxID=36881 RepID=A0AAE0GRT7_9CHLO|nr:hypothetical protein CYMTET_9896 [Cymbomonas tetramitiformis]
MSHALQHPDSAAASLGRLGFRLRSAAAHAIEPAFMRRHSHPAATPSANPAASASDAPSRHDTSANAAPAVAAPCAASGTVRDRRLSRALLQLVLKIHWPHLHQELFGNRDGAPPTRPCRTGRTRGRLTGGKDGIAMGTEFALYAREELLQLGVQETELPSVHALEELYRVKVEEEKAQHLLAGFFLMTQSLSQLVEALLLIDRLLYVHENGCSDFCALPLYDPGISPRNICVVATWND